MSLENERSGKGATLGIPEVVEEKKEGEEGEEKEGEEKESGALETLLSDEDKPKRGRR